MEQRIARTVLMLVALPIALGLAQAQTPVVSPGGIVNAATFASGYGVGSGALASVFGQNLASETAWAAGFPLPTKLAGTTVTFGGVLAPLIYVSPTQINLQVPVDAPFEWVATDVPGTSYMISQVVVTTDAGSSERQLAAYSASLGIFTLNGSGCGRGLVFNVAPDGSVALNDSENSVEPGGVLTLYGTGLAGTADPQLPDGLPAPTPPARYFVSVFPIVNERFFPILPLFAGAAPGFAGVDQLNVRVPESATQGCSVPLQLAVGSWSRSQTIPISIRRGGGRCVDSPESLAFLRWTRTVSPGVSSTPATDTLSIEFSSGVGKQAPAFPLQLRPGEYATSYSVFTGEPYAGWVFPPGPTCAASSEDRQLDAGILKAEAPGFSVRISPEMVDGRLRYSATLPAGTIRPGPYRVTGTGGTDVGPFTTAINVPEPIRNITITPPGPGVRPGDPLFARIRWEGGDPDSLVTVKIFDRYQFRLTSPTPASAGTMDATTISGTPQVIVTQTVARPAVKRFSAEGLTLGGWHVWSYEFHF